MYREKYYRSKIPLSLALLFLLNVFLVIAVELLVIYKYPAVPDGTALKNYAPAYAQCTVLSSDAPSYLGGYLVQASDGSTHLIVTKAHSIFLSRAKILHAEPLPSDGGNEQVFYVKNGIHTSEITVTGGDTVTVRYAYGGGINETATLYLVLGAALEGLELLLWHLIKRGGQ